MNFIRLYFQLPDGQRKYFVGDVLGIDDETLELLKRQLFPLAKKYQYPIGIDEANVSIDTPRMTDVIKEAKELDKTWQEEYRKNNPDIYQSGYDS